MYKGTKKWIQNKAIKEIREDKKYSKINSGFLGSKQLWVKLIFGCLWLLKW